MLTISYSTLHPWYLLILYLWVCTFWLPLSSSPSPKPLPLVTINLISFVKSFFVCEVILTYSTVLVPVTQHSDYFYIFIFLCRDFYNFKNVLKYSWFTIRSISTVQRSDSVIHLYVLFSIMVYYRILNIVSCAIQ